MLAGLVGPSMALLRAPLCGFSGGFLLCFFGSVSVKAGSVPDRNGRLFSGHLTQGWVGSQKWDLWLLWEARKRGARPGRHNMRGPLLQAEIASSSLHVINVQLCVLKLWGDTKEGARILW